MLEFVLNFFEYIKRNTFLDIIFPQTCIICGKLYRNYVCKECKQKLNKYKKIGIIDNKKLIMDKLNIHNINFKQKYFFIYGKKIYWEKMIYYFDYKGIIRKIILQYKFGGKPYISNFFANEILKNKKVYEILKLYDIIIPVPMDKIKKKKRGYNQTELISEIIAKTGIIFNGNNVLKKIKFTKTQSTLKEKERKDNIKDAYLVVEKEKVKNKKVILFDDIFTTGATANEISKILKEAGAKEILVLVIAKD